MEKLINILETPKIIIISGIGLATSLWAMMSKTSLILDPAWISIILSGIPILYYAIRNLWIKKRITAPLLISTAIISCIALEEIFAAGEVAFIMALGELLEDYTIKRTKRGINKLINLAPQTARRISTQNGKDEIVPAIEIRKGDTLRILPGETIPADGIIIKGDTTVDQSIITGESLLADKVEGDTIFCGSINGYGSVDIRATNNGTDTTLQKMIALVKEAENKRAPIQRIIDIWASWLVPIAILIALGTWIFTGDIVRGVTILVVFCPCALVLATPTAIMAAIGNATKHGFLVKEGDALERLSSVKKMTFDKTGTLTKGTPRVQQVYSLMPDMPEEKIFEFAASVEKHSEHPLGKAIVRDFEAEYKRECIKADNFKMVPGRGVSATADGKNVIAGNQEMFSERNISVSELKASAEKSISKGCTVIYIAIDSKPAGFIALSDTLRPEASQTVLSIKNAGITPVLLTGDHKSAADETAALAGIEEVYYECLPEDKLNIIDRFQKNGSPVCMIGDGVNDAPSLKKARVGIAMGGVGSDIAVDAADIALVNDDIKELPHLFNLSKKMMRTIKFNLSFSMILNIIAVILAMAGTLNPVVGALVHNGGSVFVIINSSLLLKWRSKK